MVNFQAGIHIVIFFIFLGGHSYIEKKSSRVAAVNGSYILPTIIYTNTFSGLSYYLAKQQAFGPFFAEFAEVVKVFTKGGHYCRKRLFRGEVGNSPDGIE